MTRGSRDTAHDDVHEGRSGEWMHTSLGGRFYPLDPRAEEVFISDIANGLALDCRYAGQGVVTKFYSVAEHSTLMARWAMREGWEDDLCLAVLLHDASEAYLNDLPRAVKHAVGDAYEVIEKRVQQIIFQKYGVLETATVNKLRIKDLDQRMVPLEKGAIMRYPQPWACDIFEPLSGVVVGCLPPVDAKYAFLEAYKWLAFRLGLPAERIEL